MKKIKGKRQTDTLANRQQTAKCSVISSHRETNIHSLFTEEEEVSKEAELKPSAYSTKVTDSAGLVTINKHEPVYQPGQASCRHCLEASSCLKLQHLSL